MDDLRRTETFPGLSVDELWDAWTTTEGIRSFWAPEADVEAVPGGPYVIRWPTMDWVMRGEIAEVDAGRAITFTWAWDHEPEAPTRLVSLGFATDAEGARLTIHHRPYGDDEADERAEHDEGWRHFCEQLRSR